MCVLSVCDCPLYALVKNVTVYTTHFIPRFPQDDFEFFCEAFRLYDIAIAQDAGKIPPPDTMAPKVIEGARGASGKTIKRRLQRKRKFAREKLETSDLRWCLLSGGSSRSLMAKSVQRFVRNK